MKYDLLPEFQKYSWIRLPTQPWLLRAANTLMPVIQHGRKLDSRLRSEKVQIGDCTADLIQPKGGNTDNLLIYYHGGAFLIKAAAYQKLYANRGTSTKGVDNDTADGFSGAYVSALIQELKEGTYRAKPVRREYIAKKNGKMRPLGIPSFRDKLLQEAVRMILEAIYEPVFNSKSHGFRPGKSCHTALRQISAGFTGITWFIEGDIKGCFDNIDHEVLIAILGKRSKAANL
ncbi:MAG: hypothetical protein LUD79_07440 [Oscillospiraceae bacterium]|nr:hypothetical protein [Oscillospiraceae bacterium]